MRNRLLLFCLLSALLAGCAALPPRLQESGLNSRFPATRDMPFSEYIRQTGEMIEKARVDIHEMNREVILAANRPFELTPDEGRFPRNREGRHERGILLIHGLSDSPYFLKPLARHLRSRGFLVLALLLPGHGTIPGDLRSVSYREWIRAVEYGVDQLQPRVEKLYLGGFSAGGALCFHEALKNRDVRGLILFAPALNIKSRWASMADLLLVFTDWLGGKGDDKDYAKYESFSVNGGAQIYRLTREIDAALATGKRLAMPVFAVLSEDDIAVDSERVLAVFRKAVTSPRSRLILYGKGGTGERAKGDQRILSRNSRFPEERILDYAHVSLLMPPDDPHYGRQGGYKYCLHYRDDRVRRMSCLHDPRVWLGEITPENLNGRTLRRLTFNPRYDEMLGLLDRFLETVESP